jgi:hypothetical protein
MKTRRPTRSELAAQIAETRAALDVVSEDNRRALHELWEKLAEFSAAHAQLERSVGEAYQSLAAYTEEVTRIAERVGPDQPATLERIFALQNWLGAQPPTDLLVSVVMPTRNRPALLREAIASVQAQTHAHWELIVVDDGSADDTAAVLDAIDDDRIRCLRTEGVGSSGARNAALEVVRGEAIAYLDDDNLMLPGWLAAVAWAFSHFDHFDMLYGARVMEAETAFGYPGELPRIVFSQFDRERLVKWNFLDTNVIAHRAGLPEGRWDPEMRAAMDWELAIRLTADKPALALPVLAVLYRTRASDRILRSVPPEDREADREKVRARVQRTGR